MYILHMHAVSISEPYARIFRFKRACLEMRRRREDNLVRCGPNSLRVGCSVLSSLIRYEYPADQNFPVHSHDVLHLRISRCNHQTLSYSQISEYFRQILSEEMV
jgi:hypothetical protein